MSIIVYFFLISCRLSYLRLSRAAPSAISQGHLKLTNHANKIAVNVSSIFDMNSAVSHTRTNRNA